MGIREEIERLRISDKRIGRMVGEFCERTQGYNEALDNVLSILDKWECILDMTFYATEIGEESDREDDLLSEGLSKIKPGDAILIYKRRRDEDE